MHILPELPEGVIQPRLILLRLLPPTVGIAHRSINVSRTRPGRVVELFLQSLDLLVAHLRPV